MNHTTSKEDPSAGEVEHAKANLVRRQEAQQASDAEHSTTFKQAMRENWKSALWSAVISLGIVMEGYDVRIHSFRYRDVIPRYFIILYLLPTWARREAQRSDSAGKKPLLV